MRDRKAACICSSNRFSSRVISYDMTNGVTNYTRTALWLKGFMRSVRVIMFGDDNGAKSPLFSTGNDYARVEIEILVL